MLNWILLDSAFCDGSAISGVNFEFQFYRLSMLYWNFLFLYIWFIENYGYEQTENYSNSFIHWIKLIYYKCILFFMITFHILGQFNCCKDPLSFTHIVFYWIEWHLLGPTIQGQTNFACSLLILMICFDILGVLKYACCNSAFGCKINWEERGWNVNEMFGLRLTNILASSI